MDRDFDRREGVQRTRFFNCKKKIIRRSYEKYHDYNSCLDPNKLSKKVFNKEKKTHEDNLEKDSDIHKPPYRIIEMEKNRKRRERREKKQRGKDKLDFSLI